MALPFILLGVGASFLGGTVAGQIISNATEQPDVVINTQGATVTENKKLSNSDFLIAGALGVAGWYIWKRYLK